jgi:hypothetical protein
VTVARWLGISWFGVCAALAAAGDIEITGTVLDSETGKPIDHAMVTATISKSEDLPHPDVLIVQTGEDGKFQFAGLPEGRFDIGARKAGYLDGGSQGMSHGHAILMSRDLTIHLTRQAVIKGTVRDDHGFPVAGAGVAIRAGPGKGSFDTDTTTDTDGAFRVAGRVRGKYRVGVFAPGVATLLRVQGLSFSPVYYPGTSDASAAVWIDLVPGQEFAVDLQVTPVPAREIRGRLEAGVLRAVSVLPAGNDDYRVVWGVSRHQEGSREFTVTGLAPGTYVLELQVALSTAPSAMTFLRKTVEVVDADVTNVVVSPTDRAPVR